VISFDNYQGEFPDLKLRRDELRARKLCINGPMTLVVLHAHGPVIRGGKCQKCIDVHKAGR